MNIKHTIIWPNTVNQYEFKCSFVLFQALGPIHVLLSGYDLFQRVAIATEMVLADMTDHGRNDFRRRCGRWWRQAVFRSNRIIQSIYMNLKSRAPPNIDINQLSTHSRTLISESVRCANPISEETIRNIRDLAILQNVVAITDHYRHMFILYAQDRSNYVFLKMLIG